MNREKTFLLALGLVGAVWLMAKPSLQPEQRNIKIEDAAEIGDTVQIKYPASTTVCSDRDEAFRVFLAGEQALRESQRVDGSALRAVGAESDARKLAMRQAASCRVMTGTTRDYTVRDKAISGSEADALHTVVYCLVADRADKSCLWLEDAYGRSSPFTNVEHRTQSNT